ncbi:MAG: phosphate acyltransferase PlsX [Gammaproteobacteria bacterium]|nr:MAG: phosphate acyltransferase PlsX [Gammaproteobacteria bacterium]RLA15591.1 MAG: phosphate acyltransferase PlsX [Gammaproteobacteria bacterium]RLA15658.1 MAG: phosphate acyltransferase PlsX [Gammaproteobacteria bacterium]
MKSIIAVDAMGGDRGPAMLVPATLEFLVGHPDAGVILVGDDEAIRAELPDSFASLENRVEIRHCSQVVTMDESPTRAMRTKKDSSMRIALDLVKAGEAHACVSAGNTGALMAIARFVLKMLPGIERPAIVQALPSMTGSTVMLDLGANSECRPEHLVQFAVMGSVLAEAVGGVDNPTVALLNIGSEEMKGNELVQLAAEELRACDINYYGYVEGNDIYEGTVDVVVCDGFVGNVALKTSEGIARMISHFMREEFTRSMGSKLAAVVAKGVLKKISDRIDHRRYNGASFLGLRGTVIKSHGSADSIAFGFALEAALSVSSRNVPELIGERVLQLLAEQAQ